MKYKYLHVGIIFLLTLSLFTAIYIKLAEKHQKINQPASKKELNSKLSVLLNKYDPQPVNIDSIFLDDHSWTNMLPDKKTTTFVAVGDVMLGRSVNKYSVQSNNFSWHFEETKHLLNNADLTFINLESPFNKECNLTSEGMRFCSDTRNIQALQNAGIDIANLANNHIGDQGKEAMQLTQDLLNSYNIATTGTMSQTILKVNNITFAFIGYNDIPPKQNYINWADEEIIPIDVKQASTNADVVVVSFHWGVEYQSNPTARQKALAYLAIDSGADLVIGHHPHWIQPVEVYKNKLIVYSLGNFVFDQMWSQKTREGVVGKFVFYEDQIIDAEFIPILIENPGKPTIATNTSKDKILNELSTLSKSLSSEKK
jgi:poly-gamma-glutamate synthesis protein (capsule biosynthesis protein)